MRLFISIASLLCVLSWTTISAQEAEAKGRDYRRLHYLSEEEMNLDRSKFNVDFTETPPPSGPVRMVGEFEPQQAVLIRYTFGIPYSLIREMAMDIQVITVVANSSQATTVNNLYVSNNVNTANCSYLIAPSDSYWTRDYGPWFIFDGQNQPGIVDFPYNRPRPNDNNIPPKVAQHLGINLFGMNVTHTGGNMMADGLGMAASTELVYEENTTQTAAQVNAKMLNYLGITRYDVMNDPLGDYIKHVDCWGKYLAPDKILLGKVPTTDSRYADFEAVANYFATTACPYGYPYKVYRVMTPGGNPATPYTNSLILNNRVFVPQTGSQHDAAALAVYQQAMPGYQIIGIPYSGWLDTDALHCRTHEIADLGMLFIDHRPLYGQLEWQDSIQIQAKIIPCSGQQLLSDSLKVYYNINGGALSEAQLLPGLGNQYSAWIKNYGSFDTIRYYVGAADASGRSMRHPYMAQLDPHQFITGQMPATQLTMTPDTVFFITNYLESFVVNNPTPAAVTIESFSYGSLLDFDVPPQLPLTINPGEELSLNLVLNLITDNPAAYIFVKDSVMIHSSAGLLKLPVMINFDLISSVAEQAFPSVKVLPNPFRSNVGFELDVPNNYTVVELTVFNSAATIVSRKTFTVNKGKQLLQWNGDNVNGEKLTRGVYYFRLQFGNQIVSGKLLKLD